MPLNKPGLELAIKAAFKKQAAKTSEGDDPARSVDELASDIADAVDVFIKSALVTVTGASPSGPVTGTGIIS